MTTATPQPPTTARPIVLYGREELARLAWYCLTHDSRRSVAGFTVRRQEMPSAAAADLRLLGLPLVPFEDLEERFPPERHDLLIAIGPHQVNHPRAARFEEGLSKGYRFASYLASGARLWPDLKVGPGCMIFENVVVEPFSRIGANTVVRTGAHVSHDAEVGKHVFLAPRVAIAGSCNIGDQSFVGVNATLRDSVAVAPRCVVGAGAVVARSTEPDGVYVGVPARRVAHTDEVRLWP